MIERKDEFGPVAVDSLEIANNKTDVAELHLRLKHFSLVVGVTRANGKTCVVLSAPTTDTAAIRAVVGA